MVKEYKEAFSLLDKITLCNYKGRIPESYELFLKLIKYDIKFNNQLDTKIIIAKITEFGESFKTVKSDIFVKEVNRRIKENRNSLFLRIIRQEIMYNIFDDVDLLLKVNSIDLERFPFYPEFLHYKSIMLSENEDYQDAIVYVNLALKYDPDNAEFLYTKAMTYLDLKNYDKCLEIIEYVQTQYPEYLEFKFLDRFVLQAEAIDDTKEELLNELNDQRKKTMKLLKKQQINYITLLGIFVAFLTITVRIATFNYQNFENLSFGEILVKQIAINSPWLISIGFLILVLIWIHYKKDIIIKQF